MVVVFHRKDKLTFTTQAIDSCCLTCIDVGVEVYFRDLQHRLSPVDLSFTMVSNEIDYVGHQDLWWWEQSVGSQKDMYVCVGYAHSMG